MFLDNMQSLSDVFLVSQKQVLDWVKDPVSLSEFKTETYEREANCTSINCELKNSNDEIRYMASCTPCPHVYPWLDNPLGEGSDSESQRV